MRVGVVDIGTNSMRLLITDGVVESGRWVEVTGLGRGVDATGRLSEEAMARTLGVLARYGNLMDRWEVERRAAMATSATRDAVNREEFMLRVSSAIGVRPDVITGDREGTLAYAGASADLDAGPYVVSDIGGGSTEFVTASRAISIDIGSVRLSDRVLPDRPATTSQMGEAAAHVRHLFSEIDLEGELIGVAGTWTSIAAIDLGLAQYDREAVHHHRLTRSAAEAIRDELAGLTVEQTAAIPSLDPGRAAVILAGAVVAVAVMESVDANAALISEHDTLDGRARELLGLT